MNVDNTPPIPDNPQSISQKSPLKSALPEDVHQKIAGSDHPEIKEHEYTPIKDVTHTKTASETPQYTSWIAKGFNGVYNAVRRKFNESSYIIDKAKTNGIKELEKASPYLKSNPDFILRVLKELGAQSLAYASADLLSNNDFMYKAVEITGLALRYGAKNIKNDDKIVQKALEQNGNAIIYASYEKRTNEDLWVFAIDHGYDPEQAAILEEGYEKDFPAPEAELTEEQKSNAEFMLSRAKDKGLQELSQASEKLTNDPNFMLRALKELGAHALYYAKDLSNNKHFMLDAVRVDGHALQYGSYDLKTNPLIIYAALRQAGRALEYLTEDMKSDFLKTALNQDRGAIYHATLTQQDSEEIMQPLVKENGGLILAASKRLQANPRFILSIAEENPDVLNYINLAKLMKNPVFNNSSVVNEFLKNHPDKLDDSEILIFKSEDPNVMLAAVRKNVDLLQHASQKLRGDKKFMTDAKEINPEAVKYASEDLRWDDEFIRPLIQYNPHLIAYASKKMQEDREFILKIAQLNYSILDYVDVFKFLNDSEFKNSFVVVEWMKKRPDYLTNALILTTMSKNKDFMLAAIKHNNKAYQYTDPSLKDDPDIKAAFEPN